MLNTLPAAYTYGQNNHYPLTHIVRMEMLSGSVPHTLYISTQHTGSVTAYYTGSAVTLQTKYLGASIANMGGEENIQGLGEVEYQLDLAQGGGVSATDGTSLLLLNQGRFSSEYEYDMENQNIEIWEGFMPPSGSLNITGSMVLRFKGIMRDVGSYDYERFEIPCVSNIVRDTRPLPFRKINKSDFPNAPDDYVGQPLPIVFGDFYYQQGENIQYGYSDVLPAFCVDEKLYKYVVAEHDLGDYVFAPVYKMDNGLSGVITSNTSHSFSGSVYTLELTTNVDRRGGSAIHADFYIMPEALGYYTTEDLRDVTDTSKVFDRVNSTFFNLTASVLTLSSSVFGPGNTSILALSFGGDWNYPGKLMGKDHVQSPWDYDFQFHVDNNTRVGSSYAAVLNRDKNTWQILSEITSSGAVFGVQHSTYWGNDFTWENLYSDEIAVTLTSGSSINLSDMYIKVRSGLYNVLRPAPSPKNVGALSTQAAGRVTKWTPTEKDIEKDEGLPTNIYASTLGIPTPELMARGGYVNGDVIDNPAYAIEYLLRYKLGVGVSSIDTGSFDAVGNTTNGTRKGWLIDGYMADQRDAFDWISQICYEFSIALVHTNEGKYRLVTLEESGTEDHTIESGSIAAYNGVPLFSMYTTPTGNIENNINISYRYDYATKKYLSDIYIGDVNDDNDIETNIVTDTGAPRLTSYSAFVADSISRYNMKTLAKKSLNFIRDRDTAELALKALVNWNAFKHLVVRASLIKDDTTRRLQIGDKILINTDLIPSPHRNVTQFIITRVNYPAIGKTTEPYITIEAMELPNARMGLPVLTARFISSEDLGL